MNNVFTAIQNRDGEALSRMSGYEHQYVNNDNVVNMSAERLVDALFKQLKQLFPAAVVTNLKTPEQEVAAKQQWIAAFAEGGIRTREQVSAGMRHARASESPFWPSPGQFIKWCKDSKMVLGVTIDDVMAEFHRYSKEKSLYPGGPERFPWRHPVMYWVVCDMLALGPVKALQLLQKRKSQLIDKATNPPMVAPTSLKNQRASLLPGDITYIDQITGQDGFRPAYLVNPSTADLVADIQDTRQIINSAYFVDLFMMLQNINTRSMPVEAVIEMKEEKLLMLGPVLERLNDECLNPLIDRAFSMMVRKNMLPPPPDAMEGMPLKVEYISVMAQAQKSIGLSSLASTVNFIGQLAQAKPEALDKLNVDQAIDAFADMSGVSPTVIVPQEQVEQARQQRAQQQQQQQMMAMGMAAAQGAKTLSEAKTSDPSVLSAMANAVSGQGGQSQ